MNCDLAKERMVERWMTGIGEDQRIELDGHIASCPGCHEEFESVNALWNGLGDLPIEEPSRNLRPNFHHMLEAYRLGAATAVKPKSSSLDWLKGLWPRQPLMQFAMAGAALVFGLVGGHFYTARNQDHDRITALNSEMQNMRQLVALSLLQQQSASDRLRGVGYSVRMEPAGDEVLTALIGTLNHDTSVNVRLEALDALKRFSSRAAARQGLRAAMVHQDSPLVQIALIDWAVESKDRGSVDSLEQMKKLTDLNPAVEVRLARALDRLKF